VVPGIPTFESVHRPRSPRTAFQKTDKQEQQESYRHEYHRYSSDRSIHLIVPPSHGIHIFMYHTADEAEYEITSKLDFVVPLKQVGLITRAVLEAIHQFYGPRRIIVISSKAEGNIVRSLSPHWNAGVIDFIDEETFFERNLNVTIQQIIAEYDAKREGDQREPGWWIQQLIKLGAASQIPNISTHYVVWDGTSHIPSVSILYRGFVHLLLTYRLLSIHLGDLIPTRRWRLAQRDRNGVVQYFIAVLQAEARSEFNSYQYAMSMRALTGDTPRSPQGGGTFVAHHMVFNKHYVQEMLELMCRFTGSPLPWPLLIMSYSRRFYRFSEYKTYATFMLNRHPADFHYHPLSAFGDGGLRFRDANRLVEQMLAATPLGKGGMSYAQVTTYAQQNMAEFQCRPSVSISTLDVRQEAACTIPGYIQLDHVYGIAKLCLDPDGQPALSAHVTPPRGSLNSTSGLPLAELLSAAYAGATPAVADELCASTAVLDVDIVVPPGCAVTPQAAVAALSSSSGSSLTASAEFKVSRLRIGTGRKALKIVTPQADSSADRSAPSLSPVAKAADNKVSGAWKDASATRSSTIYRWSLPS
jgi:hypothetical protein